jgi:flagellar L-ring protein precursor FlgH
LALATGSTVVSFAHADSIWDRRDPRYAYLFQDNRARSVGDVITVVISETTVANEADQRALKKANSAAGTVDFTGSASSGGGTSRSGAMSFNLSDNFKKEFSGSAQTTMNRVFTDKMAVTVVDVMPNGNLVIEGYRSRVVAGEERVLRITGIVRQLDVGVGNLVQSQSVANFRISYLGRGPESKTVNQGYLGRAMNLLWPW